MSKLNIEPNTLFTNDNLYILNGINSNCIDLIYIDPPFNTTKRHKAPPGTRATGTSFTDTWTWRDVNKGNHLIPLNRDHSALCHFIACIASMHSTPMMAYITYMAQRIIEMHRVLKPTGAIYLHCDPTASHYLKIVMDCIFGRHHFQNEMVWHYKNASRGKKRWAKSHDIVFYYSKSEHFIFNRDAILAPFESSMTQWRYRHKTNTPTPRGKTPDDVFILPALNTMANERTGYPTQKPLSLMRRLIEASSFQDDIIFDPFCGSATTLIAAQQLGRRWLGIDTAPQTFDLLTHRLKTTTPPLAPSTITHHLSPPHRTDLPPPTLTKPQLALKTRLYHHQAGLCTGCQEHFQPPHLTLTLTPTTNTTTNTTTPHLLCLSCHRLKGNRPLTYLHRHLTQRQPHHDLIPSAH